MNTDQLTLPAFRFEERLGNRRILQVAKSMRLENGEPVYAWEDVPCVPKEYPRTDEAG